VRLRPLTEAECYARCYGSRHDESVSVFRIPQVELPPPPEAHEPYESSDTGERREAA
jgi:hypothetical protein